VTDTDPFPAPPEEPADEPADEVAPAVDPAARSAQAPRRSTVGIWVGLAVLVLLLGVVALAITASGPDDVAAAPAAEDSVGASTSSPGASGGVTIDSGPRTGFIPEGSPIPDWSGPALDGGTIVWAERPDGPTVLAIWAPWCPHCQAELPRLSAAVDRHPSVSLVTIATAVDPATGPTPQEYMDGEGLTFPVALDDEDASLAKGLGVASFPTTYFVDAAGMVVGAAAGELDPDALDEVLAYLETT
jgi:cytochrome c biogenesis protein CcmG/thiol:disulfide interchange protein DsbE